MKETNDPVVFTFLMPSVTTSHCKAQNQHTNKKMAGQWSFRIKTAGYIYILLLACVMLLKHD